MSEAILTQEARIAFLKGMGYERMNDEQKKQLEASWTDEDILMAQAMLNV